MKKENAIEVRNVKKRFKTYYDKGHSLKEKLISRKRNRFEERWVLNGISFEIKKGEAVGLVGRNGCGKSTTLKMLTRIMYPTEGEIEIAGRVSSLIELGAGFHPDMTGKENIFINASIFGLTHDEIEARLDDIIKFSELEEFINNPVRTYSSGMYMRLAFAVAINVDADVLLVDEILAVGDVNFQTKCFKKLEEIKEKGTTIVIVSHAMEHIEKICDRAIWIENGLVREIGPAKLIGRHYLGLMEDEWMEKQKGANIGTPFELLEVPDFCVKGATRRGNQQIHFTGLEINGQTEQQLTIDYRSKITVTATYEATEENLPFHLLVGIIRTDGVYCFGTSTELTDTEPNMSQKNGRLEVVIDNRLVPGEYLLDVELVDGKGGVYDLLSGAKLFQVVSTQTTSWGIVDMKVEWKEIK